MPPTHTGRTSTTRSPGSAAVIPAPITTTRPSATTITRPTTTLTRIGTGRARRGRGAGKGGRGKTKKGAARKGGGKQAGQASRGGKRPRTLALTLGAVFVVAVVAAAYFLVLKPHSSTPNPDAGGRLPTAGASPSNQACVQQYGGVYCHIELRSDDPAPLTLGELFPPVVNNEANGNGNITSSFTLETDQAGHVLLRRGDRAGPDQRRSSPASARRCCARATCRVTARSWARSA